jgi:hypothetical protein|nr:MAG TPA: hypothetical protein [Inoviridae sp.]
MSTGSSYNLTCYPSQLEAMQAACSAFHAVGPDGSVANCTGVATTGVTTQASATSGGAYHGLLTMDIASASGAVTHTTRDLIVGDCERYDFAYWSPAISAWVAAAVAIIAARFLYVRVFNRESL